jgi:polysaccharide biosynthesis protein PslH
MTPKKILVITNRVPYPLRDGGNLAMNAMLNGYSALGWQVALLSMNTTRHKVAQKTLESIYTNLHSFEAIPVNNNFNWISILKNFFFSSQPEHAVRFFNVQFLEKIKETIVSFQPDVIQIESIFLTTYLSEIKKISSALTVLRLHNIEFHIWQSVTSKSKNFLKKYYFKVLTRRIKSFELRSWKKYDLLLPITKKDAEYVHKVNSFAVVLVAPFGINIQDNKNVAVEERWVGYHIAAMDWIPNREGVEWFLEKALPKIRKAVPKFEFYFAGRKMPKELKDINIPGVFCLDEVADANEFIKDKKILIVPLLSGSGIRVKILEAMAAGKVVISTVNGIKGIDAKHGEHYLLANRPEDFAKWIKWVLENKEEAEQMVQRAKTLVHNRYNYLTIAKNISTKIEDMLENGR